jgi:hypothetical protein
MVKPKKPVFGKSLNLMAVSIKEKSISPMKNFRLNLKDKRMSMVLVGLKFPNAQNLLLERSSITKISNGVIFNINVVSFTWIIKAYAIRSLL